MDGKLFTSILTLLGLIAWTKATYVEAVAGAFDVSQNQANLQIAMACGHHSKYMDTATGQWSDDLTSTCLINTRDILTYCKKKYPDYDITNIVEADHARNITSWCTEDDPEECSITILIVPFRCLVGSFESDALVVPSQCRFRHLHEEGSCQSPQQWKRAAKGSCRKTKMRLESTGMLLPCDERVDLYQGVEYVCCPRPGHEAQTEPREEPREEPQEEPQEEQTNGDPTDPPPGEDPYFTEDLDDDEGDAYEAAKTRLANQQREKVARVMQQYREAQGRLNSKDKKYMQKKGGIAQRYEDTIADIELETNTREDRLHEVHESRIESKLSARVTAEEQHYLEVLDEEPLKSKKILKAFERYMKAVQKKRQHVISHYRHMRRTNPQKARQMTDSVLEVLKIASSGVNENIKRLQKLPEIYRELEESISDLQNAYSEEADVRYIQGVWDEAAREEEDEEEEEQKDGSRSSETSVDEDGVPGAPTDDFPLAATGLREEDEQQQVDRIEDSIGPTAPNGEQDGFGETVEDEEDMESPTEFRTTLNIPEDDTQADPGIQVVAVKPIESYRDDETDFNGKTSFDPPRVVEKKAPAKDAHSKVESHVRSKSQLFSIDKSISKKAVTSTPALAFALACGILGVVVSLVVGVMIVRKKKRRVPVSQGFTEVDPNLTVEQRHIVSMQQNGYENPTYKYFEMQ